MEVTLGINWETFWLALFLLSAWAIWIICSKSLPKYLEKKGENLADKQDIQALTRLFKEIEQQFNDQSELLRAKLDLSTQIDVSLRNEERLYLLSLYSNLHRLKNIYVSSDLAHINEYDVSEIGKYRHTASELLDMVLLDRYRIDLFVDDENGEIIRLFNDVINYMNEKMRANFNEYTMDLIRNNRVLDRLQPDEYSKNVMDRREKDTERFHSEALTHIGVIDSKLEIFGKRLKTELAKKSKL